MTTTITAETRAKAAEARAEAHKKTRLTTRPGSEDTVLLPGDRARVADSVSKPYRGRVGTVVALNRQEFPHDRGAYVEVGVFFGKVTSEDVKGTAAHAWFRDDELEAVKAPFRRSVKP